VGNVEGDFALIGLDGCEKLNDVSELARGYVQRDIVKLGNCVPQSRTDRNVLDRTSRRVADRARLLAATGVSTQANPEPSDASDSGVSGRTTGRWVSAASPFRTSQFAVLIKGCFIKRRGQPASWDCSS
jgi:hypothetical protein